EKELELHKIAIPLKVPESGIHLRKIWVVKNILKEANGHSLIYCNRPSECRSVASGVAEFNQATPSKELMDAIEFIKAQVHPDYYLVDHLQNGIGYHYGRMPQFVRTCVKNLFENRKIDFLCCTSTLLEGVNLPARNIVLYKPKSGHISHMDKSSILNLAGRAGRLLKDYYGNIYCIDFDKWQSEKDVFDGEPDIVKSAVEKTLTKDTDLLIEHLREYQPQERGKKSIETIATSLIIRQLRDPTGRFMQNLTERCHTVPPEKMAKISKLLQIIAENINDLKDIVLKNRSLDARLQFNLYKALQQTGTLELPLNPSNSSAEPLLYDNLKKIFEYISTYLLPEKVAPDKKRPRSYLYYAFVAKYWLLQSSYKRILENKISHTSRTQNVPITKTFVNDMIDDLDEILETDIKYEYSRCLQCYCDILAKVMKERGDKRPFCEELSTYLEAGASDHRIFLLLSAGLSRNSAISIYERIDPNIKDISTCIDWLRSNQVLVRSELHPIMHEEFDAIIGEKSADSRPS
ncbi:MAG: helicase-related protein, partial [Nitrososphaerales archaeon]